MGVSKIGFLDQKMVQNEENKQSKVNYWQRVCEKKKKKRVVVFVEEMLTLLLR